MLNPYTSVLQNVLESLKLCAALYKLLLAENARSFVFCGLEIINICTTT